MCVLDPSSGAAHSVRSILETLAGEGCDARSFTASLFDSHEQVDLQAVLGKEAGGAETRGKLVEIRTRGVGHRIYRTASSRGPEMTVSEQRALLHSWRSDSDASPPDVVLSYGTSGLSRALRDQARSCGALVVHYVGNAEIDPTDLVEARDRVVCPSRFLAESYRDRLETSSIDVLRPIVDRSRLVSPTDVIGARSENRHLGFVTFVNPLPHKGLTLVERLIERAQLERPAMRFLIIEGRMPLSALHRLGVDLTGRPNVWWLPSRGEMASVLARTSLLLMPSFWNEGFGRLAVEAQLCGIPVLASRRGGLPEALGDGPEPLPIPDRCAQDHYAYPDDSSVERWWRTLCRLWDDRAEYDRAREVALEASKPLAPEETRRRVIEYFRSLVDPSDTRSSK